MAVGKVRALLLRVVLVVAGINLVFIPSFIPLMVDFIVVPLDTQAALEVTGTTAARSWVPIWDCMASVSAMRSAIVFFFLGGAGAAASGAGAWAVDSIGVVRVNVTWLVLKGRLVIVTEPEIGARESVGEVRVVMVIVLPWEVRWREKGTRVEMGRLEAEYDVTMLVVMVWVAVA